MTSSREQSEADDPVDTIQKVVLPEPSTSDYVEPLSDHSSGSQPGNPSVRSRYGKRKLQAQNPSTSRTKRLKAFYNDDYRKLFNDTAHDLCQGDQDRDLLPPSQIGLVTWSSEEKQVFFSALAKRGKDDVGAISASIGTKSAMEVQVYLQLLSQATLEQHLYERHHQLLGPFDLPGAFEISPTCCEALEQAADALEVLHHKHEEKLERQKHSDLWLLDHGVAELVDQCMNGDDEGRAEVRGTLPAAELVNLKSLLQLSTHVFMNSNELENNWQSYAERSDTPSILFTAFSDFYNLVISLTKRLVQSSLYFAMSRLRATDSTKYTHKGNVRRRDVTAALHVLGMKANAHDFWIGCARRCKLDVYRNLKRNIAEDGRLSYEEVESELNFDQGIETECDSLSGEENQKPAHLDGEQHKPLSSADEVDYHLPDQSHEHGYSSDWSSKASSIRSILGSSSEHVGTQVQLELDQDNYCEILDNQAGLMEEHRLWNMLGRESSPEIKSEEMELPKRPMIERSRRDELIEWRDWVRYRSEWEKLGPPVPASSFYENRKRKMGCLASTEGELIRRNFRDGRGRRDAGYDGSDKGIESKEWGGPSGDSGELTEEAESEDANEQNESAKSVAEDEAASKGSANDITGQTASEQTENSTDSQRESSTQKEANL